MKKILSILLALTMLLALLAGCGNNSGGNSQGGEPSNNPGNSQDGDADQSAARESLVVAVPSEPKSLDAHGANDNSSTMIKHLIYDTLLKQADDGSAAPNLVESWDYEDDLTLNLHLRSGVKFHNGETLDAGDVLYNIKRAYASDYTNWMVSTVDLEQSKVIDDTTLQLKLTTPTGAMLAQLCFLYIVDEQTVEGGADMEETPIGTGPFVFDSWFRGDRIDLKTNQEYWGTVAPFNNLTMRVISESSSRAMEIEAGGVDVAINIASNDMANLDANPDVTLMSEAGYSNSFIGFNCSSEPFNNKTLRQAVSYALDRASLVQAVFSGTGSLANGPIAPTIWGYDPDLEGYSYDVEKAKALMAEAGYPDGLDVTLTISDSQERVDIAEMVQNQLGKIGINVTVEPLENATYLDRIIAADCQMFILGWVTNTGDADYGLYEPFYTGQPTWANTATYGNPEVDRLLDIGKQSTDSDVRFDAYCQVQRLIVEDAPWVFLCNKNESAACRSDIQGFKVPPSGRYEYNTITFN